jgi:Ca2+-binding EF-hand superfamily protein
MERSVFNLNDQVINSKLKIPKYNKNANLYRDFLKNRRIDKIKFSSQEMENDRQKLFESNILNPSLGPNYLKKKYSDLPKENLWNFENKFKTNYSKKLLGSILIANRIQKEDDSKKYENTKNSKFLQVSRLKMKWKTIKWILEHKKDVLDRLMDFHENILKISNRQARDFDKGLTKSEFTTIMKRNGITNDLELINKIFWVFDEDGDNDLKYKEIAFGIEMFRDSTIDQKLKAFFDLCDTDNSGSISKLEFFNLMKKNIINNDEKMSMKDVVDKIFSTVKLDKNGDITL